MSSIVVYLWAVFFFLKLAGLALFVIVSLICLVWVTVGAIAQYLKGEK